MSDQKQETYGPDSFPVIFEHRFLGRRPGNNLFELEVKIFVQNADRLGLYYICRNAYPDIFEIGSPLSYDDLVFLLDDVKPCLDVSDIDWMVRDPACAKQVFSQFPTWPDGASNYTKMNVIVSSYRSTAYKPLSYFSVFFFKPNQSEPEICRLCDDRSNCLRFARREEVFYYGSGYGTRGHFLMSKHQLPEEQMREVCERLFLNRVTFGRVMFLPVGYTVRYGLWTYDQMESFLGFLRNQCRKVAGNLYRYLSENQEMEAKQKVQEQFRPSEFVNELALGPGEEGRVRKIRLYDLPGEEWLSSVHQVSGEIV
jgi:hypothetical protein